MNYAAIVQFEVVKVGKLLHTVLGQRPGKGRGDPACHKDKQETDCELASIFHGSHSTSHLESNEQSPLPSDNIPKRCYTRGMCSPCPLCKIRAFSVLRRNTPRATVSE